MPETSSATSPAEGSGTTQTTDQTSQTSSTTQTQATQTETPPAQATQPSNETPSDGSVLSQEAKPKEGEGEKPKAVEGAPEKYDVFKAPEGYELDTKAVEEASAIFKEAGLTQAVAQKLVDLYSKHSIETASQTIKSAQDTREGWVKEAKALPGIGSELGPQGKVVVQLSRALDSLVSDQSITRQVANDFRHIMGFTGAGDHPAVIQVVHALTSHFAEGTPVRGNAPSPHGQNASGQVQRKSAAQEMYPTLPSVNG